MGTYNGNKEVDDENKYYEPVRTKLEEILKARFHSVYLVVTAKKVFPEKLKAKIRNERDIVFFFLRQAAPDITGFVREYFLFDFVVVEIKVERIRLDDIYQAKKYADLFEARYALLISTEEIPEEIKRLYRAGDSLLQLSVGEELILAQFDKKKGFVEWFPENPFI